MLAEALALIRRNHIAQRIKERNIDIDVEYCVYIAEKFEEGTAIFLGTMKYLGDNCHVILIVRGKMPVTIECRRISQKCDCKSLGVVKIERINAI